MNNKVLQEKFFSLYMMLTEDCNFRCEYCFGGEPQKTYMSKRVFLKAIKMILPAMKKHPLQITFFGGEPFMNWEIMKYGFNVLNYLNKVSVNTSSDIPIKTYISTNGLLATPDKLDYINKFRKLNPSIQFSLDGHTFESNSYRMTNKNIFDTVMSNFNYALKNTDLYVNVRLTINDKNIENFADSVIKFYELGVNNVDYLQNDSIEVAKKHLWSEEKYYRYYYNNVKRIVKYLHENKAVKSKSIDSNLYMLYNNTYYCNRPCEAGYTLLGVFPDGKIYPCTRIGTGPNKEKWLLGDVFNGISRLDLLEKINNFKLNRSNCGDCKENTCIMCIAHNDEINNDIEKPVIDYCEFFKISRALIKQDKEEINKYEARFLQ